VGGLPWAGTAAEISAPESTIYALRGSRIGWDEVSRVQDLA